MADKQDTLLPESPPILSRLNERCQVDTRKVMAQRSLVELQGLPAVAMDDFVERSAVELAQRPKRPIGRIAE